MKSVGNTALSKVLDFLVDISVFTHHAARIYIKICPELDSLYTKNKHKVWGSNSLTFIEKLECKSGENQHVLKSQNCDLHFLFCAFGCVHFHIEFLSKLEKLEPIVCVLSVPHQSIYPSTHHGIEPSDVVTSWRRQDHHPKICFTCQVT